MTSNNISMVTIESWFVPLDILMILCTSVALLLSLIFLSIIIFDRTCHTVPMLLIGHSCLSELFFSSIMFSSALFTLVNDLQRTHTFDFPCVMRGYLGYVVTFLQNYSYLLQAIYRYVTVVHPTRIFWRSTRVQLLLICLIWMFGFVCTMPYILTNQIEYHPDDQICQMPLRLSFLSLYNAFCVYLLPVGGIVIVYLSLLRYVRQMHRHITPMSTLSRADRELKMVRRIVILVNGLATIGIPYALFVFWGCFGPPPKYHFRIAYIFIDVSLAFVMIALLQFTEPLRARIVKTFHRRANRVIPTTA